MAAAASSNPLALRAAAPAAHPHHHLLQGPPLSHAILRPAPGPIRTTHGPILFSPYWHRVLWGTATPKAHCEDSNIPNQRRLIGDTKPNHLNTKLREKQGKGVAEWSRILSSLLLDGTLPSFQGCVRVGGRGLRWNEQRRDCHYTLTSLVHLSLPSLPLPCNEDLPWPPQQDRRNTCRPLSKHYTTCGVTSSGPGWFAPVISAQCGFFCLILCTSKPKTLMFCQ